ncbi:MAG: restriction endonuclease subunit S [Pseudomonadota bacterium]
MSAAGFLEKLLDGAQVEWLPLNKLVETVTAPSKAQKNDYRKQGRNPIVDQGATFIAGYAGESFTPLPCDAYVIFGDHSEHIKYVDFAFVQGADGLKILKPEDAHPKYVYHALLNFYQKTGSYKRHWSKAKETPIPIPCPDDPERSLAIQGEIVRILDSFTELTAELTAELNSELTARKRQYNYYRDQLLTFDEDEVEWKKLVEVFNLFAGGDKPKGAFSNVETEEFNVPVLSNGIGEKSLYGWTSEAKIKEPSLTVSARGTIGWTSYRDRPIFPIIRLLVLTPKIELNLRYAYHYMKTIETKYKVPDSGIPQLTKPMIQNVAFPIPFPDDVQRSIAEQERIATILDKFDTLTTSISEGLPREIALREKQYAYYRDQLLSFPKPGAEAA